jgi:hypothetical protein
MRQWPTFAAAMPNNRLDPKLKRPETQKSGRFSPSVHPPGASHDRCSRGAAELGSPRAEAPRGLH